MPKNERLQQVPHTTADELLHDLIRQFEALPNDDLELAYQYLIPRSLQVKFLSVVEEFTNTNGREKLVDESGAISRTLALLSRLIEILSSSTPLTYDRSVGLDGDEFIQELASHAPVLGQPISEVIMKLGRICRFAFREAGQIKHAQQLPANVLEHLSREVERIFQPALLGIEQFDDYKSHRDQVLNHIIEYLAATAD